MNNKKCQFCKKELNLKFKANNKKFCSMLCRNRNIYWNKGGKDWQKNYVLEKRSLDTRPKIKCEICGLSFRQVGSHIVQTHGVTAREYREAYGFDVKRGQLPVDLREHKAEQVFENGTVENLKKGKKFWFKKGAKGVGIYKRSLETLARLKNLKKLYK